MSTLRELTSIADSFARDMPEDVYVIGVVIDPLGAVPQITFQASASTFEEIRATAAQWKLETLSVDVTGNAAHALWSRRTDDFPGGPVTIGIVVVLPSPVRAARGPS